MKLWPSLNSALLALLLVQLSLGPSALAMKRTTEGPTTVISTTTVGRRFATGFATAEREGWKFYDSDRKEVGAWELIRAMEKRGEFFAVSPDLSDVAGRIGVRIQLMKERGGALSFRLGVGDRDFATEVAARRIRVSPGSESSEATLLRIRRTLGSLAHEVSQRRGELAHQSVLNPLWHLVSLFGITPAHAGTQTIAKALYDIASVALLVDFAFLAAYLWSPNNKGWFGMAVATATVIYIASKLGGAYLDEDPGDQEKVNVVTTDFEPALPKSVESPEAQPEAKPDK